MSNMPRKLGVIYGPLAPSVGDRAPTRKLGPEGPRGFTNRNVDHLHGEDRASRRHCSAVKGTYRWYEPRMTRG